MVRLLDERVPRTLDQLVTKLHDSSFRGSRVQAWLFEDVEERRAAERTLATAGVHARFRSAYKPLVHFFLEELNLADLSQVTVRYPVHNAALRQRFLLEAYPLAALVNGAEIQFIAGESDRSYDIEARDRSGQSHEYRVFAPNRLRTDYIGERALSPTGWLKVEGRPDNLPNIDEPLETEFELAFRKAMAAISAHRWPREEPYFDVLRVRVETPGIERRLDIGDECMSTHEALHEDIYFSVLEFCQRRSGRAIGDRRLQPGQIVPEVRRSREPRVIVELQSHACHDDPRRSNVPLEAADAPMSLPQVHRELALLGGQAFSGLSRQGRPVRGAYWAGWRPPILLTAGQHANETSGVVGALRAARRLLERDAHFAIIPVENPDGYVLHGELCVDNPRHMHHAARYTALGDDLEYRTEAPWFEKGARLEALRISGAQLHVNLHGYPAHEWTRPLTGYVPRGFEFWTVPKGFFLIMRHRRGWAEQAMALIEEVTFRLAQSPELVAVNRAQIEAFRAHSDGTPFTLYNDIPCLITESEHGLTPLTLITEFPDETIYGASFRFAHTVQMETVLAVEDAFSAMMRPAV